MNDGHEAHAAGDPTPARILQLGTAFGGAKTLLSAVELGVFAVLAQGPLDSESLRARLGLHPRGATDFFDALVAFGMLERDNWRYRNTPETGLFLDPAKPSYLGGFLNIVNTRGYPLWGSLTEALRTGRSQNAIKDGGDLFADIYGNPQKLRQFLEAMTSLSGGPAAAIAQRFPWQDHETFVDIGCAEGVLPVAVAKAHSHITGGGYDLPPVQPAFDDFVSSANQSHRLKFHPGDFFHDDTLPPADVLAMGHVLHNWGLDAKRELLRKAHAALPEGGALIVYENLIDDERRHSAPGLIMSLQMLLETEEGFDFTGADCRDWMRAAGFRETRVEPLAGRDSMVVGIK